MSESSLRKHPQLQALFRATESRQMTEQELEEYCRLVPEYTQRAIAAREITAVEQSVVQKVVDEIFAIYPYEQFHQIALGKCTRDVRYVSAYATLSMLMNDPQWFSDKLLIWFKTILHSFEFPDKKQKGRVLFSGGNQDNKIEELPPHRRSIYETYFKLKQQYQRVLTPSSFHLIESYLQQAIDVLSGE
ncbi:MAG: hypothetical protein RIT27_1635 [Pseudomonadota bacterium]|jgi:hypothetical protein